MASLHPNQPAADQPTNNQHRQQMNLHIPDNNLTAAEMFALFGELALAFLDQDKIWIDQEGIAIIPTNYGKIEITVEP